MKIFNYIFRPWREINSLKERNRIIEEELLNKYFKTKADIEVKIKTMILEEILGESSYEYNLIDWKYEFKKLHEEKDKIESKIIGYLNYTNGVSKSST